MSLAWYDRNPQIVSDDYNNAAQGPHSSTVRLTYVCPIGKMAMLELLTAKVFRMTVATDIKRAIAEWCLNGDILSDAFINDKTVGARDDTVVTPQLLLVTDDTLYSQTYDYSADGTCRYLLSYKITEFDAVTPLDIPTAEPPKPDIQAPTEEKKPWWWPF